MKSISKCLLMLFAIAASACFAVGQEQKPSTASATERPKNEVEKAMDEAKSRGENVLSACVREDCGEPSGSSDNQVEPGRAIRLVKPEYPPLARAAKASGQVEVQILIGLDGSVVAAAAVSGHPLLMAASVRAARDTVFTPSKYNGQPVKVVGVLLFNFVAH